MTLDHWIAGILLALALPLDLIRWGPGRPVFRQIRRALEWVARRPSIAVIGMGLLGGGWSALHAAAWGLPEPTIHDEFSYLLMADTFAHGRLANPPHPMSEFFETFHVLQQPMFASKYPPATAILLAAGKVFGGHPAVGVWLGVACASAGTCWMMLGWLRPRWAILGSLVACTWLVLGYWSRSYWGGALAAFGGALVFGALRRILRNSRTRDSLLLGLGLVILANTRPFEGLVISVPAGIVFLVGIFDRHRRPFRESFRRSVLPVLGVLSLAGAGMGYYNHRVTGSVWLTPYQLYHQTLHEPPLFLWQSDPGVGPPLTTKAIENYSYQFSRGIFESQRSREGFTFFSGEKLHTYGKFYFGPVLALTVFTLPLLLRDRWMRLLLAALGLLGIALVSETWVQPHYAAPATGLIFVLVTRGLRTMSMMRIRTWRPGVTLVVVLLGSWLAMLSSSLETDPESVARSIRAIREPILRRLGSEPGLHLVIAREEPVFQPIGWINNEADIDGSRIVWARDLGMAKNESLIRYYQGRRIWLLLATRQPPLLQPYPQN